MDKEELEIEMEKRRILQDEMVTDMRKNQFINKIKNGLGEEIKKEPNKIQKKPSFIDKLLKIFMND